MPLSHPRVSVPQLWAKLIPFVRGAGLGNQRRSQTPSAMGAFGETSADNHGMD